MPNEYPNSTKRIFTEHGFDSFINSDRSVSAWIPIAQDGELVDYMLVTASDKEHARTLVGY